MIHGILHPVDILALPIYLSAFPSSLRYRKLTRRHDHLTTILSHRALITEIPQISESTLYPA